MNIWQLSWNHKNYDYRARMKAAAASDLNKYITQSWGRSSTANISRIKEGDLVYVSCDKKCIMKGVIIKPFRQSTKILDDDYVLNHQEHDERHKERWYCEIKLTEIYFDELQRELKGNQNTFCDPVRAFWKS